MVGETLPGRSIRNSRWRVKHLSVGLPRILTSLQALPVSSLPGLRFLDEGLSQEFAGESVKDAAMGFRVWDVAVLPVQRLASPLLCQNRHRRIPNQDRAENYRKG